MAMPPEQRRAQQVWVGIVNRGMWWLYEDGLRVWRGKDAGEWPSSAAELTGHLDVLGVPYSVEVRRGLTKSTQREYGFAVRVATADLSTLTTWVPSLQRKLDALAGPEAASDPPAAR